MKATALTAVAIAALISTPALAQNDGNFSGPRIEVRGGWDFLNLEGSIIDGTESITREEGKSGAGFGGEIGYDYRVNNIVVGGYAGIAGSTVKECSEVFGNDEACLRSGRDITFGLRAGAVVSDSFMIYAKGGYSNGRAKIDYKDYDLVYADLKAGENLDGFHLGAGVEGEIGRHIYGRLEYVFSDYGKSTVRFDEGAFSIQPTRHQVVYGMGVRF